MIAALQRIALRIWCATPSHWLQAAEMAETAHEETAEVLDIPATAAIETSCIAIVTSEGFPGNSSDTSFTRTGPSAQAGAPAAQKVVQHGL